MNSLMVRCWRGGNGAAPPPRSASSQQHRVKAPRVHLEFLGALLDSSAFVGSLDGAEPDGLGGDLIDGPAFQLFGLAWHAGSIGQRLCRFNTAARCARGNLRRSRRLPTIPRHSSSAFRPAAVMRMRSTVIVSPRGPVLASATTVATPARTTPPT